VSVAALIVSLTALAFTIFWNISSRRIAGETERRTLFLRLHESLVAEDLARGRGVVFRLQSIDDARNLLASEGTEYHLANRALAMLDVLALFVERGYVDKDLVMGEWREQLALVHAKGAFFTEARAEAHGVLPWPHLRVLAAQAAALPR
jgi:hypothetical protein